MHGTNTQIATAIETTHAPARQGGAIAPILMGAALTAIGSFGVMLAARAPDDYGYVAGFGFLLFAYVMTFHYFGKRA